MTVLIKAHHLNYQYGSHQVLHQLDLTVEAGQIVGLIGENGAGKTTLLNLLLGIKPIQTGQLTVFGDRPGVSRTKARIGSMLQGDILIQGVTVAETLKLAATHYSGAMPPATLLEQLKLTKLANQRLTGLSGGQLRRVTFALALIGDPDLLFLDEPTVGMDENAQRGFWKLIQALRQRGKPIIITSHHLAEIQNVADRILLLKDGQLAFQGSFQALQKQYQRVDISCQTTLAAATFQNLPGVVAVQQVQAALHISSTNGDQTLAALVPYLGDLHQLEIKRESLADIFVHLTREG